MADLFILESCLSEISSSMSRTLSEKLFPFVTAYIFIRLLIVFVLNLVLQLQRMDFSLGTLLKLNSLDLQTDFSALCPFVALQGQIILPLHIKVKPLPDPAI